MSRPAIHIGPSDNDTLAAAVRDGGGEPHPLDGADALVWFGGADDFPELPESVRWVQLPAAGVESWMELVRAAPDVAFTSAAGAYATDVAEHALALLLAGVRGFARYARADRWDPERRPAARGLDRGGHRRRRHRPRVIARAAPLAVEIVAVTRSGRDVPGAHRSLAADRLAEVWPAADHFVICAPATDATRQLVGREQLAAMQPHSWIVNIARGSLIDTDALVEALQAERIGGAGARRHRPRAAPGRPPAVGLAAGHDHAARGQSAQRPAAQAGRARARERRPLRRRRGADRARGAGARVLTANGAA